MTGRSIDDLVSGFKNSGYGTFKTYVGEVTANKISEIQEKYNKLLNSSEIDEILNSGLNKSISLAKTKYEDMKKKVGLN